MHDLFPHSTVPFALSVWIAAAFCGPALGPVLAGYVVPEKGWRLGMWEIAYMAGPVCALLLSLPETHEPTIKATRKRALQYEHGEVEPQTLGDQKNICRPCCSLSRTRSSSLYRSACCIPLSASQTCTPHSSTAHNYTLFDAIPRVYPVMYAFSVGELGLSFLHVFLACVSAGIAYSTYIYRVQAPQLRNGHRLPAHEHCLRPALIACFVPPVGLLLFACTSDGSIHWLVGLFGLNLYAMGTFVLLQCLSVCLPRIYPMYSASLFASNDFFRSSLATGAIHFGVPLYEQLGVDRGVSVLGGLSVLGIAGMWFIYWKGAALRAQSRFVAPEGAGN